MPRQTIHARPERTRHGRTVWFVRLGKGPRIRIRAAPGTREFAAEEAAAIMRLLGDAAPVAKSATQSLQWLVDRYRETTAWAQLSPATRRQRENIFRGVMASAGHAPFAAVTRATIAAGMDRRRDTPAQAGVFLKAMRGLFAWAESAGHIASNPCVNIKAPTLKSAGFPVWTQDEIAAFEARWPLGTRERLALSILLYTGLRRGDAAALGRQHIKAGVIEITTEKTGTRVTIPVLPELDEAIRAMPAATGLALIATASGDRMTKESFGNFFGDACRAAGIVKSAHGLRKAGATRAAERGATVAQLNAIFGWTGHAMATLYTQSASRARLSKEAAHLLGATESGTLSPRTRSETPRTKNKAARNQ